MIQTDARARRQDLEDRRRGRRLGERRGASRRHQRRRSFPPLTLAELAAKASATGGTIVGRARRSTRGRAAAASRTHIVDVEVDPETGKVQVLRYTAVQDVGKAIHPSYVEGQMQGGAVQGIGWALQRGVRLQRQRADDQRQLPRLPHADRLDLPMIEHGHRRGAEPEHPYGVRGVGEVPIVPPPAALANAIHDAVGVRMTDLPMSPPKVLAALSAGK